MARTVKLQDAQVRLAIRTEKDAHPDRTYKDLQATFCVTYGTVILAMKRTAEEWRAMLIASGTLPIPSEPYAPPSTHPEKKRRGRPLAVHSSIKPVLHPVDTTPEIASQTPTISQALSHVPTWEYKAIVVRGKFVSGITTYEFQARGSIEWQPAAGSYFDEVLTLFSCDGWELANMTMLNHGNQPFTGLFEAVFKRQK